ncbi:MAG: YgjP-like metallopeptidase domain-containing protein [Nitrososphaerota archaeon]
MSKLTPIVQQKIDLAELLHSHLYKIYEQIRKEGRIDIFGKIDFEVVDNIDHKKKRIAKLKGNKIQVHLKAVRLPKSALKYIIAHELAHTLTKKHTRRFWKIVETIYPNFKVGRNLLLKYGCRF